MQSSAKTVSEYMASLPDDRREAIQAVRELILKSLPPGYEECMSYGMIGYVVPHSLYPKGYHCNPKLPLPFVNLASQKNYMALYLMCIYGDPGLQAELVQAGAAEGKRLDMGKSCIRFKKPDDLPLKAIGALISRVTVAKYVERFERLLRDRSKAPGKKPKSKVVAKTAAKSTRAKARGKTR